MVMMTRLSLLVMLAVSRSLLTKKGFFFALMKVNYGNFNYGTQAQVGGIHNPTLYQETFS